MTYKYLSVRREIYENNPMSKFYSFRSLSDIGRLYRRTYWILFGIFFITLVVLLFFVIFEPTSPFMWVSAIVVFIVIILIDIPREKSYYNEPARTEELNKNKNNYEQGILCIVSLLIENDINSSDKLMKIKNECEDRLKTHEDKFAKVNNKLIENLIGVPLGALIASIIYARSDAVPFAMILLIFAGMAIWGMIKIVKLLNYYSEGYFKDKYFLDIINELEYSEFLGMNTEFLAVPSKADLG